jgi:hypothetical protein
MHNKNSENTMGNKTWSLPVEADPDDTESLILSFPDELLIEAGWSPGDTLIWNIEDNGTITITKK